MWENIKVAVEPVSVKKDVSFLNMMVIDVFEAPGVSQNKGNIDV